MGSQVLKQVSFSKLMAWEGPDLFIESICMCKEKCLTVFKTALVYIAIDGYPECFWL